MRQLQNQIKDLFVAATIMDPSIPRKKLKNCKFYENMNTDSCRFYHEDVPLLGGKLENMEYVTQNAFCLLHFVVPPVVFVHLYAWQVGILINASVKCEIIKCDKHLQQVTKKLIICITETKNWVSYVSRCSRHKIRS